MRAGSGLIFAVVFIWGTASVLSESTSQSTAPCVSTPEEQGMDSNILSRGLRELGGSTKGLHSLLVIRNRCLVVEAYWPPYDRDKKHYLNSATKAVLSALVGI